MSRRARSQGHVDDCNALPTSTKNNSLNSQPTVTDPPTYVVNLDLPPRERWSVGPSVIQASGAY